MRRLLEIHVGNLPEKWMRMRGGKQRYKPLQMKAWQEFLREMAKEEIDLCDFPEEFPYAGKVEVSVSILFPREKDIWTAGDGDNVLKGVLDALTRLVIKDDSFRYVRRMSVSADLSDEKSLIGTHIIVYAL